MENAPTDIVEIPVRSVRVGLTAELRLIVHLTLGVKDQPIEPVRHLTLWVPLETNRRPVEVFMGLGHVGPIDTVELNPDIINSENDQAIVTGTLAISGEQANRLRAVHGL